MTNSIVDQALAREFSGTHAENLIIMDGLLLKLAQDSDNSNLLTIFFKHLRSIEGSAGFHGFIQLEQVCQHGTELLSRVQNNEINFTQAVNAYLAKLLSNIKQMLATIESDQQETPCDVEELNVLRANIEESAATEKSRPALETAKEIDNHSTIAIELERVTSLEKTQSLHQTLNQCINNQSKITINAASVKDVDTALLQLIAAYNIDAEKFGRAQINCKNASQELSNAAKTLQLAKYIFS